MLAFAAAAALTAALAANPFDATQGLLQRGDALPAASFTDQRGRASSLQDFHGKTIVVAFVYTNCSDRCPLISQKFTQLARVLPARDFHLVEMSIDPARDTPRALALYARRYRVDAAQWTLLTGDEPRLSAFERRLGEFAVDAGKGEVIHNDRLVIIGPDGRIGALIDDPVWSAADVAAEARAVAGQRSDPVARLSLALTNAAAACGSFISGRSGLTDLIVVGVLLAVGFAALLGMRRLIFNHDASPPLK